MWNLRRAVLLIKKLAVRTRADELQNVCVRLAVDQEQIGLEVALPKIMPFAGQGVVAVFFGQRLVLRQPRDSERQQGFQVAPVLSSVFRA